jgi:hypoxanthine phosphoribosyltransferase
MTSSERTSAPSDPVIADALQAHARADLLYTEWQVAEAYDRMADAVSARVAGRIPIVICVMNGGLVPTAELLARLSCPLELDYLHATRYQGRTTGGQLDWLARPQLSLADRAVVIIDDIFDQGYTLASIVDYCRAAGADTLVSAVLLDKEHSRKIEGFRPDIVGLSCPDRYVYGAGMDYEGLFRNLRAIYALAEDQPSKGRGTRENE